MKHPKGREEGNSAKVDRLEFAKPAFAKDGIAFTPIFKLPPLGDSLLSEFVAFEPAHFSAFGSDRLFHPDRPVVGVMDIVVAESAIWVKASAIPWIGAATSEIDNAGKGYVIRYEAADVYFSRETGAHEVHGDIRAKYNAFGAANGILGLPTTDETRILSDGKGRFNHFQGGSIYWTANTGPMIVRGPIRNLWASKGWEGSGFAYPTSDCITRAGDALENWASFQNGAIHAVGPVAEEALVVEVSAQELAGLVRATFDKRFKAADDDLGIEGGVNILAVSDWGYGFWESTPRTITYEIHGFYSHGFPLVPDPTFRLELKFKFELLWRKEVWTEPKVRDCRPLHATLNALHEQIKKVDKFLSEPMPGEKHPPKPVINPEWAKLTKQIALASFLASSCDASNVSNVLTLSEVEKTLVVYLTHFRISTSGVKHGELLDELTRKIPDAFPLPVTTIPGNALLVDVVVTPTGGLKFLLAPGPFGSIRRDMFETTLRNFIETA